MSDHSQPATPPNPNPPPKPYIETRSAHNVQLWINQAIAVGRLKKCWNLDIHIVVPQEEADGKVRDAGDSYFVPACRHNSFESNFAHIDDNMQLEILRHSLSTDPVSCPKNCTYYENRRWGWIKFNARKVFKGFYDAVKALLKGYVAFAWQTQVTIIIAPALLLILWKSPRWVPLLISLARAIWGKTP